MPQRYGRTVLCQHIPPLQGGVGPPHQPRFVDITVVGGVGVFGDQKRPVEEPVHPRSADVGVPVGDRTCLPGQESGAAVPAQIVELLLIVPHRQCHPVRMREVGVHRDRGQRQARRDVHQPHVHVPVGDDPAEADVAHLIHVEFRHAGQRLLQPAAGLLRFLQQFQIQNRRGFSGVDGGKMFLPVRIQLVPVVLLIVLLVEERDTDDHRVIHHAGAGVGVAVFHHVVESGAPVLPVVLPEEQSGLDVEFDGGRGPACPGGGDVRQKVDVPFAQTGDEIVPAVREGFVDRQLLHGAGEGGLPERDRFFRISVLAGQRAVGGLNPDHVEAAEPDRFGVLFDLRLAHRVEAVLPGAGIYGETAETDSARRLLFVGEFTLLIDDDPAQLTDFRRPIEKSGEVQCGSGFHIEHRNPARLNIDPFDRVHLDRPPFGGAEDGRDVVQFFPEGHRSTEYLPPLRAAFYEERNRVFPLSDGEVEHMIRHIGRRDGVAGFEGVIDRLAVDEEVEPPVRADPQLHESVGPGGKLIQQQRRFPLGRPSGDRFEIQRVVPEGDGDAFGSPDGNGEGIEGVPVEAFGRDPGVEHPAFPQGQRQVVLNLFRPDRPQQEGGVQRIGAQHEHREPDRFLMVLFHGEFIGDLLPLGTDLDRTDAAAGDAFPRLAVLDEVELDRAIFRTFDPEGDA